MILSFASGKGGTGKTLLATNLAWMLSERGPTTYVDADVEEPNGHLFLKHEAAQLERVTVTLPELQGSCTGCGVCQKVCAFHAILAMKHRVMVFPELCHACGACVMACPQRVLVERPYEIGSIARARLDHLHLLSGRLDVGQARSTPLVEAVVEAGAREHEGELVIVDSPPWNVLLRDGGAASRSGGAGHRAHALRPERPRAGGADVPRHEAGHRRCGESLGPGG